MGSRSQNAVTSPFVTARARARAPHIIEYAAGPGFAALVSPANEVILTAGEPAIVAAARIARAAKRLGAAQRLVSIRANESTCIHAGPIESGWFLCVESDARIAPAVIVERLRKAARVFALALADRDLPHSPDGSNGPAPAEVSARTNG